MDEKASADGRAKGNSPARQRLVCAEMFSKQRTIGVITGGEKEEFDKRRRAAVSWSTGAGRRCRWGRVIDADAKSGSFSQAARGGPSLERVLTMEPETALEAGKRPRALPDGESSEGMEGAETASPCGDVWRARTGDTNGRVGEEGNG